MISIGERDWTRFEEFCFCRRWKGEVRGKMETLIWTIIGSILVVVGEVIKNNKDGKGEE